MTWYGEEEPEALRTVPEMTVDVMPGPARTIRFLLTGQEILAVNGGGFLHELQRELSMVCELRYPGAD
jgi:hypothetical protein